MTVSVGSSVVFPSVSSPSSEVSLTFPVSPPASAVTVAVLLILSAANAVAFIVNRPMYVANSPTFNDPTGEPLLVLNLDGVASKLSCAPSEVVILSSIEIPDIDVFPVFDTVIVYVIISPMSTFELEFVSLTVAVFVTSIEGLASIAVNVGSSVVLPSASSPSSEVSLTVEPLALVDDTIRVLDTPPEFTAS